MSRYSAKLEIRGLAPPASALAGALAAFAWLLACSLAAQTFQVLHSFDYGSPDGSRPSAALVADAWGNLYGTTYGDEYYGGDFYPFGTVFKLDAANGYALTTLHAFSGPDGAHPLAAVIIDATGNVYGTTAGLAGFPYMGTVFKLDAANGYALTTLHTFTGLDGKYPFAALIADGSGSLYGTTSGGGLYDQGTVFRLDAANDYALTTLHDFSGADGSSPASALVAGGPGILYGTTVTGGSADYGTVFRLDTADSTLTTLHSFDGNDGRYPYAPVIADAIGNLYGTTYGNYDPPLGGTVFKLAAATDYTLTTLGGGVHFYGALIADASGNLYGTDYGDFDPFGPWQYGSVFRLDAANNYAMTTVHAFDYTGGFAPRGALIADAGGNLFGTAELGSAGGGGGVFSLINGVPAPVTAIAPTSGPSAGGTPVTITGSGFSNAVRVRIGGSFATGVTVVSPTEITATTPPLPPGRLIDVAVTNGTGSVPAGPTVAGPLPLGFFSDFLDVPPTDLFHTAVETVFRRGITAGCGSGFYCRDNPITRAQISVFLLKAEHGSAYAPPGCSGVFLDVPCTPTRSFAVDWIEQLVAESITAGCGGGNYCPDHPVTRAQGAIFLLKTLHGSDYNPPPCAGIFTDVACSPVPAFAVDWIEQLSGEGITGGCGGGNYCPDNPVSRAQMAAFLVKTFGLN